MPIQFPRNGEGSLMLAKSPSPKTVSVSGYVRRAPVKSPEYTAKTEQLWMEVTDRVLVDALQDPDFQNTLGLAL